MSDGEKKSMSPDAIYGYAKGLRTKLERIRSSVGYQTFKPLQEVFAIADDLCELVMALAVNQQDWLANQQSQHEEPKT